MCWTPWTNIFFNTYHPFLFLLYGHFLTHFIHRYLLITAIVLIHILDRKTIFESTFIDNPQRACQPPLDLSSLAECEYCGSDRLNPGYYDPTVVHEENFSRPLSLSPV